MCLFYLLSIEDLYGYELLRRIHEAFPDTRESAVYALLRNLSKEGYAVPYKGKTSDGPTRKYYRITDAGIEKKNFLLREWFRLRDALFSLGVK